MADLYVSTSGSDSNSGGKDSPFKTIGKAAAAAKPGTTVHVAPGTYEGGFTTTASGTPSNPITYVSDETGGARIVPPARSSSDMAWNNKGDNVVIRGFEVDGSQVQDGTPWRFGLYTTGTNSVVEHNTVHGIAHDPSRAGDSSGGGGIYGDGYHGGTNITVRGNEVYDIGPDGADSSLIHGIYHSTTGTIADNTVHGNAGVGIHLWHDAHEVDIVNNTVTTSNMGIWVGGGDTYRHDGPADHVTVSGNSIHDNRAFGVAEGGDTGTNNRYLGNEVSGNGTDWRLQNGLKPQAAAEALSAETLVPEHLFLVQQQAAQAAEPAAEATPVVTAAAVEAAPAAGHADADLPDPSLLHSGG